MFLKSLLNDKNSLIWTIFHICLAIACTISPFVLIAWFYLFFLTNIFDALSQLGKRKYYIFLSVLFYLISFEMLGRMAKTSPFIPTELGKYFLLFFSIIGLFIKGIRSSKGIVMFFLLLPAFLYDLSGFRVFSDIVSNLFNPLATAVGLALLYRAPVSQSQLNGILHLIWFTALSALIYSFIRTPDLDTIEFTLKAQFETTADAPSNQVSTILGMGMFLSFYSVINRLKFSGNYFFDICITLLFAFQGLISFSRGGMIIAAIGMIILLFNNNRSVFRGNKTFLYVGGIGALVGLFLIFQIANNITGGALIQRYSGETQGTLLGTKEKTANLVISGRLTIFSEDIDLWLSHPLIGVGAASSRYLRNLTQNVSPHIEFSRLLAEHGLLGLLFFILMISVFVNAYRGLSNKVNKGLFLAMFSIALLSTFHNAMRTFLSPAFFILASLLVLPDRLKMNRNEIVVDRSPEQVPDTKRGRRI